MYLILRHTGPELHTGGMRGSKFACYMWQGYTTTTTNKKEEEETIILLFSLYTTAQGPEFGHTMRHGSKPAGFSA